MNSPSITNATLVSKKFHCDSICEFVFRMEKEVDWKPGQFAMITIQDGNEKQEKRAYSIASSPLETPYISFIIKRVEKGRATSWMFDELEEKDEVQLSLPFGHMTLEAEEDAPQLIIATGVGCAPMFSIIDYLAAKEFPQETYFIFGCRHEEELCHHERMKQLAHDHHNFHYIACVSQPSETWHSHHKRANSAIDSLNIDFALHQSYICGSPQVAMSLKKYILEKGVDEEKIKIEAF